MKFLRRLPVVALVALALVGIGWAVKQYDPVYEYFQKGEAPDRVEGQPPAGATPRTDDPATTAPESPDTAQDTPSTTATPGGDLPDDAEDKDESSATPGEGDHAPKDDDVPRDDEATAPPASSPPASGTPSDAPSDNAETPDTPTPLDPTGERLIDENKAGDDGAHEMWPALQFADLSHASIFTLPTLAAVIIYDKIRRRRPPIPRPRTASL